MDDKKEKEEGASHGSICNWAEQRPGASETKSRLEALVASWVHGVHLRNRAQ